MSLRRVLAAGALVALLPFSASALTAEDIYAQTFSLFNQIISLQKQLIQSLDATVADLKVKLSAANNELSVTKGVLSSANSLLSESQKQLSTANSNLASAQSELTGVKSQLFSCQNPSPPPPTPVSTTPAGSCVVHNPYCGDTVIPNGEIAHHSCCAVGSFQICLNGVLSPTGYTSGARVHVTNGCGKDPSYFTG